MNQLQQRLAQIRWWWRVAMFQDVVGGVAFNKLTCPRLMRRQGVEEKVGQKKGTVCFPRPSLAITPRFFRGYLQKSKICKAALAFHRAVPVVHHGLETCRPAQRLPAAAMG